MKVDRKTVASHRAALLTQGGRLFRRHGVDGVGVADITAAAGLTHGAFYGHFASKTALAAESCSYALETSSERWRKLAAEVREAGGDPIAALIDDYLTSAKRDSREQSCAITSLGHEASRDPCLLTAMAVGIDALTRVLEELVAERRPDLNAEGCAEAALAMLAAMSGGLALARLLIADPERSAAALRGAAVLAKRIVE